MKMSFSGLNPFRWGNKKGHKREVVIKLVVCSWSPTSSRWSARHVNLDLVRSRKKRDLELCRVRAQQWLGRWDTGRSAGACVYPTDWGPNVRKYVVMRRRCEQSYGDGRYGRRAFDTPRSYCCLNFEITADNRLSYNSFTSLRRRLRQPIGLASRCQPWNVSDCFLIWHTHLHLVQSSLVWNNDVWYTLDVKRRRAFVWNPSS